MGDIPTAVLFDALARLGFRPHRVDGIGEVDGVRLNPGPQTVYRHDRSDTFFAFPVRGRRTLPRHHVQTIREIAVGRGAATDRAFDRAMAAAKLSAAATKPVRHPPRRRPNAARVG